jgi:uncharacterized protein (TIGR04551 family)
VSGFRLPLAASLALLAFAPSAHAEGTEYGQLGKDIRPREKAEVSVSGAFRTRGEVLYNLDLDRGLTPSGAPLFPVSQVDPSAQSLTHWDMRLRTDLSFYAPGETLSVKVRIDALDNLTLGSLPDGPASASTTQRSPADAIKIRRAYGQALLPFGLLVAGRMGTHWGLGLVAHGGECADCDSADAADRIGFVTALVGHVFALSYDFTGSGPIGTRAGQNRFLDLEPRTQARTASFAWLKWYGPESIERRRKAGKTSFEYGAYLTHRSQAYDVPGSYLPTAQAVDTSSTGAATARGFTASAADLWLKLSLPHGRVEFEASALSAQVDQASLVPGILLRAPVKSTQFGAALETDFGDESLTFGADAGYASGDSAPGFGVVQKPGGRAPKPGDLDGPQANPPRDRTVNNFRFHPDYRIDRILFREIIGTVTDAAYVRPHGRVRLAYGDAFDFSASASVVASMAIFASSTPGGKAPLGVEIDPSLLYSHRDGFLAALDYGLLFPLAGLDNTVSRLSAKPAQLLRLRLGFQF